MQKFIIVVIMMFIVGCASALSNAERDELNKLRSADRAARIERADRDKWQPPGSPQLPATSPKPPSVAGSNSAPGGIGGQQMIGGIGQPGVATVSEVVIGERNAYLCLTGNDPRQVRKGRLLKLVNNFCDGRRDGGLNCADNDYDGYADNESYLAFEIDGKPVATDTQGVLKPLSTCYVDVGRVRQVNLTVIRYANIGTHRVPRIDPNVADGSYSTRIRVETNVTEHWVNELRF